MEETQTKKKTTKDVVNETPVAEKKPRFKPYGVTINANVLRIRKDAGTDKEIVGLITDKGVYTIVKEANGEGALRWGKLENGAGWIALDYTTKV